MIKEALSRGHVIEYDGSLFPGFIRDRGSLLQIPFYYADGRYMVHSREVNGVVFTPANEIIENDTLYQLRQPKIGDELIYRVMGEGALARVMTWTYAVHYEAVLRGAEKPSSDTK